MISTTNYFREIEKIGVDTLPETLLKGHELVAKSTSNGSNWNSYEQNETIRKVIDLYFEKLNQYVKAKGGNATAQEQSRKAVERKIPTPKPPRQTRLKKEESKATSSAIKKKSIKGKLGKHVEHIREEVKFIKRYVALHNKVKSPSSILSLIKSLQRSIVQRLIRKTSPLVGEIRAMQDKLVNLYNSMKGDMQIELHSKDLNRLVSIAGGEQVYPSINIIKRYIGMQGKQIDSSKIELFQRQIDNALKNEKVKADDPYRDKVQAIHNTIKKLKAGNTVNIARAELNGLEGIVKSCGCKPSLGKIYNTNGKKLRQCNKRTYTDAKTKGACSFNKGLSGVLTAEEMASRTFEKLNFNQRYSSLIGQPAKNFTMMLHGEPNAGKTTFLLKFAKYLAEFFGKVLYISSEEFSAATMTDKVNELLTPFPENLFFYANLEGIDLSEYDFVILDSVNDLGLTLPDFKALRKDNPDTAFILILQHTKDGQYRGGKDWEHEVEIAGEVTNGTVTIYRNRYGVKGTMNFFNDRISTNTNKTNNVIT
ncbi:MAG: hypothetical protein WDO14_05045 [Bacteroidota bacterium]